MKTIMRAGMLALVALFQVSAVAANDAWWVICGACQTEMDFRKAVLAAPGGDREYFVSNPETGESRKFIKRSTLKETGSGVVQTTEVEDLQLAGDEAGDLAAVLESARVLETEIERADLMGEWLDRDAHSVAGDLGQGALSTPVLSGLRIVLYHQGLFPDAHTASEAVGTPILHIFPFPERGGVRWWPLRIRVEYPDGSALSASLSPDAQEWSLLHVEDAAGEALPVRGPDSSGHAWVDAAGFVGREFRFGTGAGADALLDWLNAQSNPALECDGDSVDKGYVRIACRRAE